MERQVVVPSFSTACCAVAKCLAPDLRVELLSDAKVDEEAKWEDARRSIETHGIDGLNLSAEGFMPERLVAVHAAGRTMAVWTVDDPAEMRVLLRLGVDGIVTDRPDLLQAVLGR
jgi:glycerophosphoryl diester phosphodiesterase